MLDINLFREGRPILSVLKMGKMKSFTLLLLSILTLRSPLSGLY